ncbi:DivIVA domain-containing protein [Dermabacteraceae bacterium TAE3-ERU27]|nr:DivIVA domain-containing protein [Dermabacteraceae bacterium TAE3-ERU27]
MSIEFPRVSVFSKGYSRDEVDEFMRHAQQSYDSGDESFTSDDIVEVTFAMERGGYSMDEVDKVLDRLADAIALRKRDKAIAEIGEEAWVRKLSQRAAELTERLERPEGLRFAPGLEGEVSYDRDDVDALCQRLIAYFGHGHPMSVDDVRLATFRSRKGADGYDEAVVDVFLDHVADIMASVP